MIRCICVLEVRRRVAPQGPPPEVKPLWDIRPRGENGIPLRCPIYFCDPCMDWSKSSICVNVAIVQPVGRQRCSLGVPCVVLSDFGLCGSQLVTVARTVSPEKSQPGTGRAGVFAQTPAGETAGAECWRSFAQLMPQDRCDSGSSRRHGCPCNATRPRWGSYKGKGQGGRGPAKG